MIFTHPNNRKYLDDLTRAGHYGAGLYGIGIQFNELIPERRIETKWQPPAAERFVEYDPADESWMRPLGLGTLREVDSGPLFYEMTWPTVRLPSVIAAYAITGGRRGEPGSGKG